MTPHRTITAAEFEASCLRLLDDLAAHRLDRLSIVRDGRVVAVVTASGPMADAGRPYGSLRDDTIIQKLGPDRPGAG